MKGKTKIILTNVETGEQEIHEDENLVTNALDKIINIEMAMNHQPNTRILPLATNALGGIMLFDGELTEDPNNIHFPVEAHLVGYANQSVNTTDIFRGSYNSVESGKTAEGYVSVWDFGTSQANGTIKAVARTHNHGGAAPLYNFNGPEAIDTNSGNPTTDTDWYPIRYDGDYLYMLKGNSSTHQMRMARVKIPRMRMGVADYSNVARSYELVASWDTLLTTYTYYNNANHDRSYERYCYADDPRMYEDGHDGYIYCIGLGASQSYHSYEYGLTYFTIKYEDESYDKSDTVRQRTGLSFYAYNTGGFYWAWRAYGHINNGKFYQLSGNRKLFYIVPINNVGAYTTIRIVSDDSSDFIERMEWISPRNGGVYFQLYQYTTSSYQYLHGILYPDGVFILPNVSYAGTSSNHENGYIYDDRLRTCDDDLIFWCTGGSTYVRFGWEANYLGTVNNLGTTITKTAAQTMKIIYTLTDIDEEEQSGVNEYGRV